MSAIPARHPSQLYAAGLEGLLLLIYTQIRFWSRRKKGLPHGQIAGEFLLGYALLRVVDEVFREPDAALIMNLSRGQFYSIFLALLGILIIAMARKSSRTCPH